MKKWIAAILTLVMLTQALPWTALADAVAAGQMITDGELQRALQIAGMQVVTGSSDAERNAAAGGALMSAASNAGTAVRVEAKESGYHSGMDPNEAWDAQMLLDWLDDTLAREIYNVTSVFARAEMILERLMDEDPETYARLTGNADFVETCHRWAMEAVLVKDEARLLRKRVGENTVVIESNTEMLINASDRLFEYEKAHYSQQIREATEALEELREEVLGFSIAQMLVIITGQCMIDGTVEPEFSAWLKDVLSVEDGPQEAAVSSAAVKSTAYNTRASRLAAAERVLSNDGDQDVTVQVVDESDFAIIIRGVENRFVGGVKVTVADLNGNTVKTLVTDSEYGSAIFKVDDFVCDYDREMEVSLRVDASEQGYRSFYVPWMIIKRGSKRTETLTPLGGPEMQANSAAGAAEEGTANAINAISPSAVRPYVYSCTFNGYDIVHQDKTTTISTANDAKVSFEVEVAHPSDMTPKAPELHCYINDTSQIFTRTVKKTFSPSSSITESATLTKYVYESTWKRDLAPEITAHGDDPSGDQRPYFVLPDTGEVIRTKLTPLRSTVDTPVITGQEHRNPMNSVMGKGFGLDINIPYIGGRLSVSLPFDKYLPKVACDPTGWVSVTFGSSLVKDPKDATIWKNQEVEAYDKAMKNFQHATSLASKKQALGTAKDYYKSILDEGGSHQAKVKFDFGYFVMFSGRGEEDDHGGSLWSLSGAAGCEFVLSADYTVMMSISVVPCYVNVNFSVSVGMAIDTLHFSFGFDRDFNLTSFDWSVLRGITFNIRLALSVTLGIGIKGICSVWVSATGCLNVIISILQKQPPHVAIYLELYVAVGFEIFWVRYSRTLWQSPRVRIYANYNMNANAPFSLFTAYAEEESEDEPINRLEPERYPSLAPVATRILEGEENARSRIRSVECGGKNYVFYITQSSNRDSGGKTHRRISWINTETGQKGDIQPILNDIRYQIGSNDAKSRDDYDFDVRSNGNVIAIVACCANRFTEGGDPVENVRGNLNIYMYMLALEVSAQGGLQLADVSPSYEQSELMPSGGYYPIVCDPRIESMNVVPQGRYKCVTLHGAFKGYSTSDPQKTGFVSFCMRAEPGSFLDTSGDGNIKSGMGEQYVRTDLHSGIIAAGENWDSFAFFTNRSFSWVGLSKPKDGSEGDSAIELYDWDMNVAEAKSRKSVVLAKGDIDGFAVLQTLDSDGKSYSQNIFYTETETVGERTENRLKGIYIAPKSGNATRNIGFDMTYTDYDLSLPAHSLNAVTIGASQYLYWLSTVSKDKESDPDIWRITGVYYDAVSGAMSDEIVIAEFSLPDSAWNGKVYKSVPFEIMLTENGTGYITAKPNIGDTEGSPVAPMTLYSFPISLKTVATLKGASLMETTVCPGEMVTTDMTVMNEGNMGVGSFDIELWLMENGVEKQKMETLHADCLTPNNSRLVLHSAGKDEVVVKGEAAFYRLKDFIYSPRQSEWIVKSERKSYAIKNGINVTTTDGSGQSNRVVTNVLVPGALGGFTGSIRIPSDWKGKKQLRLKLTRESTYSNWLAASALARTNPELFTETPVQSNGLFAASDASARTLEKLGIVKLDYALDEASGKLVLQNPKSLYTANGAGDESLRLYATEIEAPDPVDVNCDVHDIDVSHRLYEDYYGDERLEINIGNYYHCDESSIRLTCAMYLNGSETPEYISLPYDPTAVAAGKSTTIDVPLNTLFDPQTVQTARFVFSAPGIAETADVNNEFTIYPGGFSALRFTRNIWAEIVRGGEVVTYTGTVPAREGETVTLYVGVTGGTKPYRYQWQVYDPAAGEWVNLRDGKDISGANADALTLESVKGEWDGRQSRCVITDSSGTTITSDPITLRVARSGGPTPPDTGDHASLPLYLAVAALALVALIAIRRRRQEKRG